MTAQPADSPLTWSLVVPVKVLARAKSRLAVLAGPHRQALALAMAADTVAAVLACPVVDRVIAVTDDAAAARVLAGLGALVTGDEPARGSTRRCGTARRWRPRGGQARASGRWRPTCPRCAPPNWIWGCVRRRTGSTCSCPTRPARGPRSTPPVRARGSGRGSGRGPPQQHRAAGAAELSLPGLASLRRDVDQPPDLSAASDLGLGPRTAAVAALLV